jgi:hypothetical protein
MHFVASANKPKNLLVAGSNSVVLPLNEDHHRQLAARGAVEGSFPYAFESIL